MEGAGGNARICFRIFLMNVCVHCPCVSSCSIVSRMSFAFASSPQEAACTSRASISPAGVAGHCAFGGAGWFLFAAATWWDGFVFVTSWKPVGAVRRPVP